MRFRRASGDQLSFDLDSREAAPSVSAPAPGLPTPAEPQILSVAELTRRVKNLLEKQVGLVWVQGEISNYRRQSSGHHYFTLKDDAAQLACVLFAGDARLLRGLNLADGLAVRVSGELTVYERRGNYQLVARLVQLEGAGALQARFEALKRMLEAEGLFAAERKRPLPVYPRRVGVITSPTGAALRDFLDILHRRNPQIEVLLAPARVQGEGAAGEITEALANLHALPASRRPEVIVITRGGGSIEDLWQFNDEKLARAIAASPLPVISAVGHEIDFTICDFVADLRAPTPSAAAELLSAEAASLRERLLQLRQQMIRRCTMEMRTHRLNLDRARAALRRPDRILREYNLELDRCTQLLRERANTRLERTTAELIRARSSLRAHHPARVLARHKDGVKDRGQRLVSSMRQVCRRFAETLQRRDQVLRAFDPGHTLRRGFTLTCTSDGRLVKSAAVAAGEKSLVTRFADGEVQSDNPRQLRPRPEKNSS